MGNAFLSKKCDQWLRITLLPKVGDRLLHDLYRYLNENSIPLADVEKPSLQQEISRLFLSGSPNPFANIPALSCRTQKVIDDLKREGIRPVFVFDENYPKTLKKSHGRKAPFCLFAKGCMSLMNKKSIAVVGTRNPTEEGIKRTGQIARILSELAYSMVSGGARGIDTAAHVGAAENGGSTIVVLPDGLLVTSRHSFISELASGKNVLLLSQFHPLQKWSAGCAITRNRTVAGLADALIIVETGIKGGTQHTVKYALEFEKPLFVLDFDGEDSQRWAGNSFLINSGHCLALPTDALRETMQQIPTIIKRTKPRKPKYRQEVFDI